MADPSPLAGSAWLGLGDLIVINLPDRSDRRAEFAAQLRRIGLSFSDPRVRLHSAQRPDDAGGFPTVGAHGCFRSHLAALECSQNSSAAGLILCEDDLDFAPDFNSRAPGLLDRLDSQQWDILYAGHDPCPEGLRAAPGLLRIAPTTPVICAHFVIFRPHVVAALVPYLRAMLMRPPGDLAGGPMHVDGAYSHFRADHPDIVTLAVDPALGLQRASRTDIHPLRWFDRVPGIRDAAALARKMLRG